MRSACPASRSRLVAVCCLLALTLLAAALPGHAPALAQTQAAHEPKPGSADRKAILDAARPLLEVRVGPVEFKVDWLRVSGDWAFAIVDPQRPGGGKIDLSQTTFADSAEYMDGIRTYVLLYRAYGRWNVVDQAIGPTDVFWYGDPLYDRLPPGLMPN